MTTRDQLEAALLAGFAADTCSEDDVERAPWTDENPAWGHCDITALIVQDVLGGDLVLGEVHLGGEQHGFHWWNRFESGDVDLTASQFRLGQVVTELRVVERPRGPLARRMHEYAVLRSRVAAHLGVEVPDPFGTTGA